MPKITREQVRKWDAKCSNGFHFDLNRFLMRGEKEISKYIPLPDGRKLEARLYYSEVTQGFRKIGVRPTLHLSIWKQTETAMVSHGLGKFIDAGEVTDKKNFSALCALCVNYPDDLLLQLVVVHKATLANETVF